MIEAGTTASQAAPVEEVLRRELAHGDVALDTIGPILGHLLVNHDHSLFSDEIVSRVRGMVTDIARQVLFGQARVEEGENSPALGDELRALTDRLAESPNLLAHCHVLALEWQLTTRLEARNAIDPVLSPLLQALIASDDPSTASTAMALLASQARFVQRQRRMELPLGELPPDLFHQALVTGREFAADGEASTNAEDRLREGYQESASRLGLLSRLVAGMGGGARAGLSIGHAGVPLFLSAVAFTADQPRNLAVLSTNETQAARLALGLRVAGLKPNEIEEQFLYLHPEVSLPKGFETLPADRASAMLSSASRLSAV